MREDLKKVIEAKAEALLAQSLTSGDLLNITYVLKMLDGDKPKKNPNTN